MFKNSVTLLILVFIIGFVAGCGSSNPFADDAQSSIEDQNYQAALDAAEQAITEYPQDPLGYYFKAVALGNLAEEQPASQRESYYERMNDAFQEARDVASRMESEDDVPEELSRIEVVKDALWRGEHNIAIQYATDDSLIRVTPNPYETAIAHLHNATVIRPDSMLSWDVMAQVYGGLLQNYERAAEVKGKVMDSGMWEADSSDYQAYGQYLYQSGQTQQAIDVLEEGQQEFPSSVFIRRTLADLYNDNGQSEQAIQMVRDLVEEDPNNPQYRLALGTQIYRTGLVYMDSLDTSVEEIFDIQSQARNNEISAEEASQQIQALMQENDQLMTQFEDYSRQAIEQIERVIEQRPNDVAAYNTLGVIYLNWGLTTFDQRNLTNDNEEAARLGDLANQYLEQAMTNFEQVVEIEPGNTQAWRDLYNIYINLGMDEKAQEAAEKGGLNDGN